MTGLSTPAPHRLMLLVFTTALALSALLMFLIQPMVGKTLMPTLGGTPQIWNTCMVFFQAMLFLGYLHAHFTGVLLGPRRQAAVHLALAAAALLLFPYGFAESTMRTPDASQPVVWLMTALLVSVGIPVFLMSATAPLLQRWFALSGHAAARDPYFLYVASNAGSLLALIAYPTVIEPLSSLDQQWRAWSIAFVGLVGLLMACRLFVRLDSAVPVADTAPASGPAAAGVSHGLRARWLALSFVPSSLLLGVTTFITTDLAPVPLFWVVPLALYLLTFIIAFASRPWVSHSLALRVQAVLIAFIAAIAIIPGITVAVASLAAVLHLLAFFFTALVCHGELVRHRPHPSRLTEFYLWLSLGGVLGGAFNALLAPQIFTSLVEYPLVMAIACCLRPWPSAVAGGTRRWLDIAWPFALFVVVWAVLKSGSLFNAGSAWLHFAAIGAAMIASGMLLLNFSDRPLRLGLGVLLLGLVVPAVTVNLRSDSTSVLFSARTFFGTYRINEDEAAGVRIFAHGTTVHGVQHTSTAKALELGSYYHRRGAFGDLFEALTERTNDRPVAVVGLGVGELACYGTKQAPWTFFEIDPLVEQVARDDRYFSFLRDCPPASNVVIGDARVTLRGLPDRSQALIVIDAFTSDSIPTHLLTREALIEYRIKLADDGVLAIHISNRHLRLAPMLGNLSRELQMASRVRSPRAEDGPGGLMAMPAELVALAADEAALGRLAQNPNWRPLPLDPSALVWTDGYVSILRALLSD